MTELLLGTRKGLFVLDGEPGAPFEVRTRAFPGEPVDHALRDPSTGRFLATVTSPFYGPKIWHADDPAGEWTQADGVALPEGGDAALERIWVLVPGEDDGTVYAGGDPGVLFESRDGGASWELNRALWEHPTRPSWEPGGGGLCLHSIVPWPGDPDRLARQREQPLLRADQQLRHRSAPPEIAGRTSTRSSWATGVASAPRSPFTNTLMWRRMRPRSSRIQPASGGRAASSARISSPTVAASSGCSEPPAIALS